jgi:hypothetical protein
LTIFTGFPPDAYGIKYEPFDAAKLLNEPAPGLYVISAHLVARAPAHPFASDWLRRIKPIAMVAHSLYVYDIPQKP